MSFASAILTLSGHMTFEELFLKRIDPGLFRLTTLTTDWMLKADELFEQRLFYFAPDDVLQMMRNWDLPVLT